MARTVRISRRPAPGPGAVAAPRQVDDGYRANTGGLTRSGRLFAIFLSVLVAAYAIFLGLLSTAASVNGSQFDRTAVYLSLLLAVVTLYGFAITLGRTPRGVEHGGSRLVVIEFLGTRREFPKDGSLKPIVENRYGIGPLSPTRTEMVAVRSARGPERHYLVESGLITDSAA